jgi:hypothetical protein
MKYKLVSISNYITLTAQISALETLWNVLAPKQIYFNNGEVKDIHENNIFDANFIIVCGSNDLQSPQEAVDIYTNYMQKGNPNIPIIFSGLGGHSTIPGAILKPSEAEAFYDYAKKQIPNANLLIETTAVNSGHNITKSYELLRNMNLIPKKPAKVILIQSKAAQLRAILTFKKQYQGVWDYVISIPSKQINPNKMNKDDVYFHLIYALRELMTTVTYMNQTNPFVAKTEIPENIQLLAKTIFKTLSNLEPKSDFLEFCNQSVQFFRDTFSKLEEPYLK